NPMWAAFDMMTSKIYGRGINSSRFNQAAWEAWRDWCDGDVGDETRCQCNGVFDEAGNLRDNGLNHIEQIGRARVIPYGATWTVIVDKPRSPQYCFSAGNIHPDSFQWEGYEENEKVDAVEVTFLDRDRGFKKNSVMAKASWYETLNRPPKTASIELRFCNNKPQAIREAILRMQKTEKITRHGRLTCGIEAAQCEYGDVVHIIHPGNIYAFGGKISRDHSNASQIYIDQYITMPEADFGGGKLSFFVIDPDGAEHAYQVTGPWDVSTRRIDIAGSYSGNRFDTFGMGRLNKEKLLYQIMNMSINADDQSVDIEFVEYVNSVYYHPDYSGGLIAI
ncbi:MAG: phage tail protein, partial [Desulfobacteraceae bacterium]|nr:phage tail protein [Desulfobacteraceae bacterium]